MDNKNALTLFIITFIFISGCADNLSRSDVADLYNDKIATYFKTKIITKDEVRIENYDRLGESYRIILALPQQIICPELFYRSSEFSSLHDNIAEVGPSDGCTFMMKWNRKHLLMISYEDEGITLPSQGYKSGPLPSLIITVPVKNIEELETVFIE